MKVFIVICVLMALDTAYSESCMAYLDCDEYGRGESVMCVAGKCKTKVPCNKDDDCAFYVMFLDLTTVNSQTYALNSGMADMEYSIMVRGPVIAMCMKVDPAPQPGYGHCYLKTAIMVNDDAMWPSRIPGDNVMRARRRKQK